MERQSPNFIVLAPGLSYTLFLAFLIKQVPRLIHPHILLVYFQNISKIQTLVSPAWLLPTPAHSHLPGSLWQPTAWASCFCHGSLHFDLSPAAWTTFSKCHSDHITSPLSLLFARSQSQSLQWSTGPSVSGFPPSSYLSDFTSFRSLLRRHPCCLTL